MNKTMTAKELKAILWETLQKLTSKEIDVREADSIAIQSREIIRVISSQKEIIELAKMDIPNSLKEYASD